ncbi:energy-coupling factor ABC transporter ATP-binding protein [Budvicia diplopodorum]|uniref:energy-coupling factor ABC transporter ATP-binding protein n=1 Tax=Budvicia diplopodorum TaxID=1119056 RepID=UPI001FEB60ED|nr:energy-coupling factor ABC transporter ATP-binding protein [Budvicia diplopodorum]
MAVAKLDIVNLQAFTFTPQGVEKPLLGPLNLTLPDDVFFVVYGGNGSGKSTLAQLLAGWYPEQLAGTIGGSATLFGVPLEQKCLTELAAQVQLVQQSPQLQLSGCTFSVEEEIAFGPENLALPTDEILRRIDEALSYTHSEHLRLRHPATLSGGEAQRVVLACALAMHPRLLLLDEAFSRLTPKATEQLLTQLKRYAEDRLCRIILFERTLLPTAKYCPQALVLSSGQSLAEGLVSDIFHAAMGQINAPAAWRVIDQLASRQAWPTDIPLSERALIGAFKEQYANSK